MMILFAILAAAIPAALAYSFYRLPASSYVTWPEAVRPHVRVFFVAGCSMMSVISLGFLAFQILIAFLPASPQ